MKIKPQQARKLLGKNIYAIKKDGSVVSGKLVKISGQRLYIQRNGKKKVHTKAIIPLVLFDLLAIGTGPYGYGGYGYGGFGGGYGGGYGYGYPGYYGGYPGFFW